MDRSTPEYLGLGNVQLAGELVGDLLIVCGEIDENAPLDHSLALVQALMSAGKRFDLKIWPGVNHYTVDAYILMTYWDHMVRSLLAGQPPRDFIPAPRPSLQNA